MEHRQVRAVTLQHATHESDGRISHPCLGYRQRLFPGHMGACRCNSRSPGPGTSSKCGTTRPRLPGRWPRHDPGRRCGLDGCARDENLGGWVPTDRVALSADVGLPSVSFAVPENGFALGPALAAKSEAANGPGPPTMALIATTNGGQSWRLLSRFT